MYVKLLKDGLVAKVIGLCVCVCLKALNHFRDRERRDKVVRKDFSLSKVSENT